MYVLLVKTVNSKKKMADAIVMPFGWWVGWTEGTMYYMGFRSPHSKGPIFGGGRMCRCNVNVSGKCDSSHITNSVILLHEILCCRFHNEAGCRRCAADEESWQLPGATERSYLGLRAVVQGRDEKQTLPHRRQRWKLSFLWHQSGHPPFTASAHRLPQGTL